MLRCAEVFRRMFVLRIVAAADVAARSAEAKVHPCFAPGEALFAARGIGTIRYYEAEMAALGGHQRVISRCTYRMSWKLTSLKSMRSMLSGA